MLATDMQVTIYGIKNCDTMKRARGWLERHGVDYTFHDYKIAGIERGLLERWISEVGWEQLLNKSGTTFRRLPDAAKADLDQKKAIDLMLAQPSMIKRPVIQIDEQLLVGFRADAYERALRADG
jgi:Spx/MgsR family transcriptional regulator